MPKEQIPNKNANKLYQESQEPTSAPPKKEPKSDIFVWPTDKKPKKPAEPRRDEARRRRMNLRSGRKV